MFTSRCGVYLPPSLLNYFFPSLALCSPSLPLPIPLSLVLPFAPTRSLRPSLLPSLSPFLSPLLPLTLSLPPSLLLSLHSPLGKGEQSYPDLLALLIAVIVTVIVALGVKNSVGFNNVLNVINLMVWVFMMVAGLFFVNGHNWDDGRFLPFGWSGVRHTNRRVYSTYAHAITHIHWQACSYAMNCDIQLIVNFS
ncbi:unnamed protein product [Oncorhynchus mykiss]|uniref:Amino acid permease/ SLC12A domain-containing protein n=1 Tax=Oncorhynchus mykiss TaxID=8022 RepID=A0A060Z1L6_ONCMY|nr:unnamed protein product [Oncorhynchus mykiss]